MSPPESKALENFSPHASPLSTHNRLPSYSPENTLPPISKRTNRKTPEAMRILPSPPVSPWTGKAYKEQGRSRLADTPESRVRDPVLYELREGSEDSLAEQPLFPSSPTRRMAEELVSKHMAMHLHQFDNKLNRPTREEYLLALSCVPTLGRSFNHNPGAFMKRAREETENQYWKTKRICATPGTRVKMHVNIAPAPPARQPRKPISKAVNATPIQRVKRTPKPSPMAKALAYPSKGRSETPEFKAQGQKRPEDVDYNSLPDYAPPTSTLQTSPKSLKADWTSNNPLNLSNDPDRHLLHESEVNLAATLRLSCATYLCSKRRIFEARLQALRIGKEFRKTDAQQACKIDVNKASKLWTAYDRVGWFNKGYFEPLL